MAWDRDELLARTDLPALLTSLSGPPNHLGPSARWHCPAADHDDEHPSVSVFTDHRGIERWRCWSGGHAGTAIDAVRVANPHLDLRAVVDQLAARAGLAPVESSRFVPPGARALPPPRPGRPLDPAAVDYVEACSRILWTRTGRPVLDYLVSERGLDSDVLRANRVGADPGPDLYRRAYGLPRGGVSAVFPALSPAGEITYFQTRYLDPPPDRSKYDNPAARLGDNPRIAWVQPASLGSPDTLLVCEGLPDAYAAAGAGYASVAVLGAGYPDARVADLIVGHRSGRSVVVAFDPDDAGRDGGNRLIEHLSDRGVGTRALKLPTGSDDLCAWLGRQTSMERTSLLARVVEGPGGVESDLPAPPMMEIS